MISNRFDLGCIITGVVTSQFFADAFEKTILTTFSMIIATTFAFFWRRYLHNKMRQRLKKKSKIRKSEIENNTNDLNNTN